MRFEIKKILCTTDLSAYSNHALPYGIALAREFGANLIVCHVIDLSFVGLYDTSALVVQTTEQDLVTFAREEIQRLMGQQQIDWQPLILEGQPAAQLARAAEAHDVDLVITATHGRSGLKRLLIGSVTERLFRTLTCSMLVVHSPEHEFVRPAGEQIRLNRILVGCDFSPDSHLALEYAISLAQEFEAELHLMYVMEPLIHEHIVKPTTGMDEVVQQAVRDAIEQRLSALVSEETRTWCEVKTVLGVGRPYEEITKYAETQGIDLIVVGVRGHSLVERWLVGSTTDRVLRQSPCPVLTVRPKTPGVSTDASG
jgi:nucleotide-binding universal stress UspA family protein